MTKASLRSQKLQWSDPSEGAFLTLNSILSIQFAIKFRSARGLAFSFFLGDDHLLHHELSIPGVDGEVEDDVDVEASPSRLDFLTVGE